MNVLEDSSARGGGGRRDASQVTLKWLSRATRCICRFEARGGGAQFKGAGGRLVAKDVNVTQDAWIRPIIDGGRSGNPSLSERETPFT